MSLLSLLVKCEIEFIEKQFMKSLPDVQQIIIEDLEVLTNILTSYITTKKAPPMEITKEK